MCLLPCHICHALSAGCLSWCQFMMPPFQSHFITQFKMKIPLLLQGKCFTIVLKTAIWRITTMFAGFFCICSYWMSFNLEKIKNLWVFVVVYVHNEINKTRHVFNQLPNVLRIELVRLDHYHFISKWLWKPDCLCNTES